MAATAVSAGSQERAQVTWRDGKRYLWLLGLVVPLLPLIAWGLVEATGLGVFWWYGPIFIFAILPVGINIAMFALEILVAVLQAYVFAILTCLYLRDALHLH